MDLSRHNENIKEGSLSSMLMAGLITKKKIHLVHCRELEKWYVVCTEMNDMSDMLLNIKILFYMILKWKLYRVSLKINVMHMLI